MAATFMIPGSILTSISALGGSAPETSYVKATVTQIEKHASRVQSRRVTLMFDNGFSTSDWLTVPFDAEGNILSLYADANDKGALSKKGRGRVAAIKTMLLSAGYNTDQMAGGATDEWLLNRVVYLEWHAAADLGAQYGEIAGYLTPQVYENYMAEGKKPAIAGAGRAVAGGSQAGAAPSPTFAAAPVQVAAAPAPAAAAPAPANGVGAPSAGSALPPPPGGASIVN